MITDKYLHSSALQKTIRRGNEEYAVRAATALWQLDKQTFWRRLVVIACEDVGIGNVNAVSEVLHAMANRPKPNLPEALQLISLLCTGAKNRLCDSVFVQSERAVAYNESRGKLVYASDNDLIDIASDSLKPLVERAIAIWLLAGTRRYASDYLPLRTGALDKAAIVLQSLRMPHELLQGCINAFKLMPWPLMLHLPLIWQEAQKYSCTIHHHQFAPVIEIEGLPFYAADMFTRTGKACFRELRNEVIGLKNYSARHIGLCVFFMEGARVDKEWSSPELNIIQQAGEMTDIQSAGLSEEEYLHLRELIAQHMDKLNTIRQRYLNAIQGKPTFTPSEVKGDAA